MRRAASRSCSTLRTHCRSTSTTSGGTFIKYLAFTRSRPVHGVHHVPEAFKTGTRRNNYIHRTGEIRERRVEFRRSLVWIDDLRKQHQQVDVAIWTHVAPGTRAENDYLIRGEPFRDSPNKSVRNRGAFGDFTLGTHDNAHRTANSQFWPRLLPPPCIHVAVDAPGCRPVLAVPTRRARISSNGACKGLAAKSRILSRLFSAKPPRPKFSTAPNAPVKGRGNRRLLQMPHGDYPSASGRNPGNRGAESDSSAPFGASGQGRRALPL